MSETKQWTEPDEDVRQMWRITAEQLSEGYRELDRSFVRRRSFVIIRKLFDGTYLVRAPSGVLVG